MTKGFLTRLKSSGCGASFCVLAQFIRTAEELHHVDIMSNIVRKYCIFNSANFKVYPHDTDTVPTGTEKYRNYEIGCR